MPQSPDDYENFREAVVDQATGRPTIRSSGRNRHPRGWKSRRKVVHSGQDRKWDELSRLLQRHAQDAGRFRGSPAQADHLHRAP